MLPRVPKTFGGGLATLNSNSTFGKGHLVILLTEYVLLKIAYSRFKNTSICACHGHLPQDHTGIRWLESKTYIQYILRCSPTLCR